MLHWDNGVSPTKDLDLPRHGIVQPLNRMLAKDIFSQDVDHNQESTLCADELCKYVVWAFAVRIGIINIARNQHDASK